MEELKENNAPRDRAILVGLSSPRLDRKENADEESLEELGALVETAGGVSVGVVLQTLPCLLYTSSCKGENLFTVGDVKQSIYRFRLADPRIFLQHYNTWPCLLYTSRCV